jgi:CoA:oxalate CoA-transferase
VVNPADSKDKLLAGVKVLDFTQYLAGPAATRLFADFGAEIIKIERTPGGDHGRNIHHVAPGVSAFFLAVCAGKKSLAIAFDQEEGRAIIHELVRQVDVVIENYSPGVMAKYGFDYETLKAINPNLVMCSISGYGQDGPYAKQPSFDIVAQAQSGVMAMTGEPDGPPQYVGNYFGDPNAGIHAAFAIAAALFRREKTGEGRYIDISQLESLVYIDYINFPLSMMSEGRITPRRFGGDFFNVCPYGTYRAADGHIVFAVVADHQWAALAKVIGKPEFEHDPRYATLSARCERRPEIRGYIEAWLATFDDNETPLKLLADARVPSAPILEIAEASVHPQIKSRAVYQDLPHPEIGKTPVARSPFRIQDTPSDIPFRAPYLGEHNGQILSTYLGYDSTKLTALYAAGVIVREKRVVELGLEKIS